GEEHAFAYHLGQRIEMLVDGLEPEIRHADRVGVRIHQGERDTAAPILADDALFTGEEGSSFLSESRRGHTGQMLSVPCGVRRLSPTRANGGWRGVLRRKATEGSAKVLRAALLLGHLPGGCARLAA